MDKRKNNGGSRLGAGRKSKAKEMELIERLTPYDSLALEHLVKGIKDGNFACIKLFMEYRFGKPKDKIELETNTKPEPTQIIFTRNIIDNRKEPFDPLK
jgi:hypothetical protein